MGNKNTHKIKYIVLGVFFLALLFPLIQKQFGVFYEKPLGGYFNAVAFPDFTDSLFKEGVFQEKFEKALTDNVGFHDSYVRLNNQWNYWLFNISKTKNVIVGKKGYLFETSYVNGYTGEDFVGKNHIDLQVEKAKALEQALNKKNIALLFAFAPGKGSFFPEYIPEQYLGKNSLDSTNYTCYINACNKANLNFIDLRKYLLSMKETTKHPLFSQVGVHWSDYAAYLAIDTIARKIEEIKKIKLPKIKINSFFYLDTLNDSDMDIEWLMNLYTVLPNYKMASFMLNYKKDSATVKPNVLTISDSYYKTIVTTNSIDSLFTDWDYWNYNKPVSGKYANNTFDFKAEIEKRDVILLMATDATLASFPYGFINEAYERFVPKDKNYYSLKKKEFKLSVLTFFKNVEKDKKWKSQLVKNAKKNGVSETVEFFNNAVWMWNEIERIIKSR